MTPCLVFVALQCTGSDPARDRVVHLAASVLNPSIEPKTFNAYVNPGKTHVTPAFEMALGVQQGWLSKQRPIGLIMQSFFRYCKNMRGERPVILVGHNAHHFQWPLLTQELRRARMAIPEHFDLWDSLHAVRPLYEQGHLNSCRPREILAKWGYTAVPGPAGDIQAIVNVLEFLSRAAKTPPFDPTPDRIYHLLEITNTPFIEAQKRNQSNQFSTRHVRVNVAEDVVQSPVVKDSPAYNPDYIPDVISKPEPAPAPKGLEVYDQLCRWINHFYSDKSQEVLDFAELIQARHNYGKQKYNQPLMTGDGRDDLEDARQELGDLAMYVTKARMNHRDVDELKGFLGVVENLLEEKDFFEEKTDDQPFGVSESPQKPNLEDNHESSDVGDIAEEST